MPEIKVDVNLTQSQISHTISTLESNTERANQTYNEMVNLMNESQGDAIFKIKDHINIEKTMLLECINMLKAFSNSIEKVAIRFEQEDAKIAGEISKK